MTAEATHQMMLRPEFLPRQKFQQLLDLLTSRGYALLGPVVEDAAIVYRRVRHARQFHKGVLQDQAPGSYRLRETGGERIFAWANGQGFPKATRIDTMLTN